MSARRRTPQRAGARAGARAGFTVIATLVAIVLLTAGLMALAGASAQTITMQTLAQNRTNAIAIGRAYLEEIRTRDPWTVESEGETRVDAEGMPAADGPYRRTVTVTAARQNLIHVQVDITFPRSSAPITLTTSLFRGNGLSGA